MRTPVLLLLAIAACKHTQLPVGSLVTEQHAEFERFRPVAIAVLAVEAPRGYVRDELRKACYDLLFERKYSPLALGVVDAHTDSDGNFQPRNLDWDATLLVSVKRWVPWSGGSHYVADGTARLVHRSGQVLWQLSFQDQAFLVPHGDDAKERTVRSLAKLIVERIPERPARAQG
jgi:hypothetical protein